MTGAKSLLIGLRVELLKAHGGQPILTGSRPQFNLGETAGYSGNVGREVLPGEGGVSRHQVGWSALEDDRAALVAGARA